MVLPQFSQMKKPPNFQVNYILLNSNLHSLLYILSHLKFTNWHSGAATAGVISVSPSRPGQYSLHTSRTWDFIEVIERAPSESQLILSSRAKFGKDVIVGLLDSGTKMYSYIFIC